MTKQTKAAKAAVYAKAKNANFATMTGDAFGQWIDNLPQAEFFALLELHQQFTETGHISEPKEVAETISVAPAVQKPNDNEWIVYTGNGEPPLPNDAMCWVLFPDGDEAGPNRTDAFLWGGDGEAQIVAYAPATLTHR